MANKIPFDIRHKRVTTITGTEGIFVDVDGEDVPQRITVDDIRPVVLANGIPWGDITGTLSDQTDLQSELDAKQDTLLFKQNVQIDHTGTATETIVYSALISAGTMGANDILRFNIMFGTNTNNANVKTGRVYFNTSATLAGATLIGTRSLASLSNGNMLRNLAFRNSLASQVIGIVGTSFTSDENAGNLSTTDLTIDFSVDQYFIVSFQLATTTDTVGIKYLTGQIVR